MLVNGIDSVYFVVNDMERALLYYKEILELKEVFADEVIDGTTAKILYGLTEVDKARCVVLQTEGYDFGMIQLIQPMNADGECIHNHPMCGYEGAGLFIQVENAKNASDAFENAGIIEKAELICTVLPGREKITLFHAISPEQVPLVVFEPEVKTRENGTGINKLHHVLMATPDQEASIAFYKDVVGFDTFNCDMENSAEDVKENLEMESASESSRVVMLRKGDIEAGMVEFAPMMGDGAPNPGNPLSKPGIAVHAIRVKDVDMVHAKIKENGFMTFLEPKLLPIPDVGMKKVTIALSADNILTEILEM